MAGKKSSEEKGLTREALIQLLSEANSTIKQKEKENEHLKANQFRIGENIDEGYLFSAKLPFTGTTAKLKFIMGRAFVSQDDPKLEDYLRNFRSDWKDYTVHFMDKDEVAEWRKSSEGLAHMASAITQTIADVLPVPELS